MAHYDSFGWLPETSPLSPPLLQGSSASRGPGVPGGELVGKVYVK
jgi:hypothetical protein